MARSNNHNERGPTCPTWEDLRAFMHDMSAQHGCVIELRLASTGVVRARPVLRLVADAHDGNRDWRGEWVASFIVDDPLRQYKTLTSAAYAALNRLDAELSARWAYGDGEA